MPEPGVFGSADRYYRFTLKELQEAQRSGQGIGLQEAKFRRLLGEDALERVRRAVKQWNQGLREIIRNESALRLNVGDFRQTVPVKVHDGLPLPFARVVEEADEIQLWLTLHRPALEAAAAGLGLVSDRIADLQEYLDCKSQENLQASLFEPGELIDLPQESLEESAKFLNVLVKLQKQSSLVKRLQGIEEDVLGAYFFRVPEIRLYWMVVGFYAKYLKVPEEALTVVVLAHELAHAYTHRGLDIDGRDWNTKDFAEAHLGIVEGLAQFYTEVVCQKLVIRYPEALRAFKKLLQIQGWAYNVHTDWSTDEARTLEVVRMALLHTRTHRVTSYEAFGNMLEWARKSLRRQI